MESAHSPWLVVPSHPQSQPWPVKSFSLCVTQIPTLLPLSSMFKDPVITLGPFSSFRIIFIFQGLLIRNLNATCKLYFPCLCSITYAKVPQLTAWTSLGGSNYLPATVEKISIQPMPCPQTAGVKQSTREWQILVFVLQVIIYGSKTHCPLVCMRVSPVLQRG